MKLDNQQLISVEKLNTMIQEIKDRKVPVVLIRGGREITREIAPQLSSEPELSVWLGSELLLSGETASYLNVIRPTEKQLGLANPRRTVVQFHTDTLAEPAGVTEQLVRLKQQLVEMQATIEALQNQLQPQQTEETRKESLLKDERPHDVPVR